ncbi:hypothetical protein WJX74_001329 [Apatococcus lobatus]|uniref:RWP-RK domain-containing protein n=1 Tax=Apatococcus lobatus TaxID=904363 RepID=A0AAW1RFQ1_9CHLO
MILSASDEHDSQLSSNLKALQLPHQKSTEALVSALSSRSEESAPSVSDPYVQHPPSLPGSIAGGHVHSISCSCWQEASASKPATLQIGDQLRAGSTGGSKQDSELDDIEDSDYESSSAAETHHGRVMPGAHAYDALQAQQCNPHVMVAQSRNKRARAPRESIHRISLGDLEKTYFLEPLQVAAQQLGVGVTTLKKKCRSYGISRWPYRKLRSLKRQARNSSQ